jgi:hypothetical protein
MKTNKMKVSDVFQRVNKVFLDTITKNLHNNSFYYSVSPKNKGKTNAAIIPPNTQVLNPAIKLYNLCVLPR